MPCLTKRQIDLCNYLLQEPNEWHTQEEICTNVSGYYYQNRNNDNCPMIRDDKIAINSSPEVDYIIVMKDYCFKIGTQEEAKQEIKKHKDRLIRQAIQISAIYRKLDKANEGKFIDGLGVTLEEMEFYDTFRLNEKH